MQLNKEKIIERLDDLLIKTKKINGPKFGLKESDVVSLYVELRQTIFELSPPNSQYWIIAEKETNENGYWPSTFTNLRGVLKSLKNAYQNDLLTNFQELIDSEVFSDILDQADYLNERKYNRASSVVAGVALESHLRKMAEKNSILEGGGEGQYIGAENLNTKLYKNDVYGKALHSSVSSWIKLRNQGAHLDKEEINGELIKTMIMGIRSLIQDYPA